MDNIIEEEKVEYIEKLIRVSRISKAVKGGRKMSFSALMVVGDGAGRIGYGMGKAGDVSEAIRKSTQRARRNMIQVNLKNTTIPHEIKGRFKKAVILLKPAAPGTGVIAGGPVRAVMEAAGVHDIMAKSFGSNNSMNMVKAAVAGLEQLYDAKKLSVARGRKLSEFWG